MFYMQHCFIVSYLSDINILIYELINRYIRNKHKTQLTLKKIHPTTVCHMKLKPFNYLTSGTIFHEAINELCKHCQTSNDPST